MMGLKSVKILEREESVEVGFQDGSYYIFPIAHILNLKDFSGDNITNPEIDLVDSKIFWRSKDYKPNQEIQPAIKTQSIILRAFTPADVLVSIDMLNNRFLVERDKPKGHFAYVPEKPEVNEKKLIKQVLESARSKSKVGSGQSSEKSK